jgi:membrane-associated phospholipid phosphatase
VIGAGKSHGNALDRPVDAWIRGQIGPDHATLQLIANVGVYGSDLAAAAIVVAALALRRWNAAALTLISVPVAFVLTEYIIKPLVRERIDNFFTYPSGHTEAVFCVVAVLAVLLVNPQRFQPALWLRVLIVAAAAAVGVAVGIAMIGLDYHYLTDTVAGGAAGLGVVLGTALALDHPAGRRRLRPTVPASRAAGAAGTGDDAVIRAGDQR